MKIMRCVAHFMEDGTFGIICLSFLLFVLEVVSCREERGEREGRGVGGSYNFKVNPLPYRTEFCM